MTPAPVAEGRPGRRIFALPLPRPQDLAARRPAEPLPFPLGDERTRCFYFGRNAVWHAAQRLGLAGGEVLVPAYHHGVEVEALVHAGARPVFYRIRPDWQPDLDDLADRVGPDTRALYVVHFAGFPQPMDELLSLARAHRLKVVEDCALALLSCDGPRPLGARADASIFCFYKTLPVPDGGALWMPWEAAGPPVVAPPLAATLHLAGAALVAGFEARGGTLAAAARGALRRAARTLRVLPPAVRGERLPTGTRHFDPARVNTGISPLALRMARGFDHRAIVEKRRRNYAALAALLHDAAPPLVAELRPGVCPLFYPTWVADKRRVLERLAADGIEAVDFWREGSPLVRAGEFPDAEALRRHVLELPVHQDLDERDMERLAAAVRRALG